MDEKRVKSPSVSGNPQLQQAEQIEQAKQTSKPSTWKGRFISTLKEAKNRLVRFFLNLFTGKSPSKATPANIPNNLRVGGDTLTENSKVKISKENAKLALNGLKRKGFSSKEAKGIIEQISSQNIPEHNIMDQIADVSEKKYYHKYNSHSEIVNNVSNALEHLETLGYDSKKYNKFIYSLLDECDSIEEFNELVNNTPTLKESQLGYASVSDVKQDKKIYLENLQDYGYDASTAKRMIDKIYEEETNDKNNILTKILQTPTVRMRDQGYSNQGEYTKINDEYTQKLKAKTGNSDKEAYNIVAKEQKQASSKQEFIEDMEKFLNS